MKNWTVDDVMTSAVVSVDQGASYRSVVDTLVEHRISAVPVVDAFLRVMGVVSEADLLRKTPSFYQNATILLSEREYVGDIASIRRTRATGARSVSRAS